MYKNILALTYVLIINLDKVFNYYIATKTGERQSTRTHINKADNEKKPS